MKRRQTTICTVGPKAAPVTLDDLPPRGTSRWVARRKAQVVAAVQTGRLSLDAACRRYELTLEEFATWQRRLCREGLGGLKATRPRLKAPPDGAHGPLVEAGYRFRRRRPLYGRGSHG